MFQISNMIAFVKRMSYLRRAGDHVLDEVSVTGRIDDGYVILACFEFPKRYVNRNTSLTLSF